MRSPNQIQAHANTLMAQLGSVEFQLRRLGSQRDALHAQIEQLNTEMDWARMPMPPEIPSQGPAQQPYQAPPPAYVAPPSEPTATPAAPVDDGRAARLASALAASGPVLTEEPVVEVVPEQAQ